MKEAFIYDALRTPLALGTPNGSLYEVMPVDLLKTCIDGLSNRNPFLEEAINDCLIGCMTPVFDQGANIAKAALMLSQLSHSIGGTQINSLEGSALSAINLAVSKINAGIDQLVLAGGVECRSRIPLGADQGPSIYEPRLLNQRYLLPKGVAADLYGTLAGFNRKDLDDFAFESHRKVIDSENQFKSIIPINDSNGLPILDKDEIEKRLSREDLTSEKPSNVQLLELGYASIAIDQYPELERINPLHTNANSASDTDSASVLLIGSQTIQSKYNVQPKAKVLGLAKANTDPTLSWGGAQPAVEACLKKAGLQFTDIDLWEFDEPFAAVGLKIIRDFNLQADQFNISGGAIATGQTGGATGAILLTRLLDNLKLYKKNTGLVVIPVSFGTGICMVIELFN